MILSSSSEEDESDTEKGKKDVSLKDLLRLRKKPGRTCELKICCNLCGKTVGSFEIQQNVPLNKDVIGQQMKIVLEQYFNNHFGLRSVADVKEIQCTSVDSYVLQKMVEARDKQWLQIGFQENNLVIDKELFSRLMQMTVLAHVESKDVIRFFNWTSFENEGTRKRPRRIASLSKSVLEKRRDTVSAIVGSNMKLLKEREDELQSLRQNTQRARKRKTKAAEDLFDDIIFIKHLKSIAYYNTKVFGETRFVEKVVTQQPANIHVWHVEDNEYFVGYPDTKPISFDVSRSKKSVEEEYIESCGTGSIRFINESWIKKVIGRGFVLKLRNHQGQVIHLSKKHKKSLGNHIKELARVEVTHVHKYQCKTTLQHKFCNAILTKTKVSQKWKEEGDSNSFTILREDVISPEWLYDNAVTLNNCRDWYNRVMDPNVVNKTFELPISSVVDTVDLPPEDKNSPTMLFPQTQTGICGIAALSSAFGFLYGQDLAGLIHQKKDAYLMELSNPVNISSKKSTAMKFLMHLFFDKKVLRKNYTVKRVPPPFASIKDMQKDTKYYNSIMLCLLKTSTMSRDHIIGICRGWIFEPNLPYAIVLNMENMNWCAGHGKDILFNGFYEQVQIYMNKK